MKTLGDITQTPRGFEYIQFKDRYGAQCSLQVSSAADFVKPGTSAVWLGIEDARMHLSRDHVEALIAHLRRWLRHDTFAPK